MLLVLLHGNLTGDRGLIFCLRVSLKRKKSFFFYRMVLSLAVTYTGCKGPGALGWLLKALVQSLQSKQCMSLGREWLFLAESRLWDRNRMKKSVYCCLKWVSRPAQTGLSKVR